MAPLVRGSLPDMFRRPDVVIMDSHRRALASNRVVTLGSPGRARAGLISRALAVLHLVLVALNINRILVGRRLAPGDTLRTRGNNQVTVEALTTFLSSQLSGVGREYCLTPNKPGVV